MKNKRKKIRVLHVVHWSRSGIVKLLENMLRFHDTASIETHIIFFEDNDEVVKKFADICKTAHSLGFFQSKCHGLLKYYRLLRQISPDILHTHSFQPNIWGRLFSSCTNTTCVSTIHSPYPYFTLYDIKSAVKRVTEILTIRLKRTIGICVSREVELCARNIYPPNWLKIVENGIPIKKIISFRNCVLEKGTEELSLITLGRLNKEKGVDLLLKSCAKIFRNVPYCSLYIVGDGAEKNALINLATNLGIREKVKFVGYVDNPFPLLAQSDIYICSSRFEGLPLSVIEAMALGIPTVATKVGGIPSIIQDGYTGLLAEPENSDAIANAVLTLIENPELRKKIGENGRSFVLKNFDIEKTAKEYEKIYFEILSQD